jgi:transcriptional regulator with XRE-family HTH domain
MKYPNTKKFLQNVGLQLKKERKKRKYTQLQVGIIAGLEESAIQRIEAGNVNSTLKTLLKIVNALDMEFADLFKFS